MAHPSHAIRAYTAPTNEDIFSTQYAVRRYSMHDQAPMGMPPGGEGHGCSTVVLMYHLSRITLAKVTGRAGAVFPKDKL